MTLVVQKTNTSITVSCRDQLENSVHFQVKSKGLSHKVNGIVKTKMCALDNSSLCLMCCPLYEEGPVSSRGQHSEATVSEACVLRSSTCPRWLHFGWWEKIVTAFFCLSESSFQPSVCHLVLLFKYL